MKRWAGLVTRAGDFGPMLFDGLKQLPKASVPRLAELCEAERQNSSAGSAKDYWRARKELVFEYSRRAKGVKGRRDPETESAPDRFELDETATRNLAAKPKLDKPGMRGSIIGLKR